MAKRYEIHVLVNAGRPLVGEWAPMPRWFEREADALRAVEEHRALDRAASGWAKSYRVVEKAEVTVDQICAELDRIVELQRERDAMRPVDRRAADAEFDAHCRRELLGIPHPVREG